MSEVIHALVLIKGSRLNKYAVLCIYGVQVWFHVKMSFIIDAMPEVQLNSRCHLPGKETLFDDHLEAKLQTITPYSYVQTFMIDTNLDLQLLVGSRH